MAMPSEPVFRTRFPEQATGRVMADACTRKGEESKTSEKARYSTWIRTRKIVMFWSITMALLSLGIVLGTSAWPLYFIASLCIPFLYISMVISLSAYRFSGGGNDYQGKIHRLVIDAVERKGNVLDIGCGNGNLIIQLAGLDRDERCIGIDYWGSDWEYSKSRCENNARLEGTSNVEFMQGSASKLPFEDESVSNVVSCLTFHEVMDVQDKTDSLKEALRVLDHEGTFTFLDLFDDRRYFSDHEYVRNRIEACGGKILKDKRLSELMDLPFPLDTDRVLKHAVLICGIRK